MYTVVWCGVVLCEEWEEELTTCCCTVRMLQVEWFEVCVV